MAGGDTKKTTAGRRTFGPWPSRLLAIPLGLVVVALVFLASKLFPSVPQAYLALIFAFAIALAFAFGFPRKPRRKA
jgi:MFS superfamily sulfate permease-like transporter